MSLYLTNSTATLFGATRKVIASSDATAETGYDVWGGQSFPVLVEYWSCDSAGALVTMAGSKSLTVGAGGVTFAVPVAAQVNTSDGIAVRVKVAGTTVDTWYKAAAGYIPAGTHNFTLKVLRGYDGDADDEYTSFNYGATVSYIPDTAFVESSGSAPTITTHPSNATDRTFAQSTIFTAAATADPAATVQWQRMKPGGAWTNITGATSDTLTISAAGHNFQYRAAYTNAIGTTYTNAATLTMSTSSPNMAAGTYAAEVISDYLSYRGSTAVAITGVVAGGTGSITIDNPALQLSGTDTSLHKLTAWQVVFKAFKDISGLTLGANAWQATKTTDRGLVFATDAHFGDVTGTATISNCVLDDCIWLGSPATGGIHNSQYAWTRPNLSNLTISDCTLDNFIRGAADGVTLLRVTGVVDANTIRLHDYPWSFGGNDVHITDCDLEATFSNCVLKVASHGKSSKGWHVSGCTFTGGTEEQTGCEAGYTRFVGHVTAKTATSITVAVDMNGTGGLRSDAQLLSTGENVGSHVLMLTGDAAGHFHEITAQTNGVLTIDTATWDTSAVAADDEMMVAQAMVGAVWENNTHVLKYGYIDQGNGCNVGYSSWGNALGNTVSDAFTFPHPLTLATRVPGRGTSPEGPVVVAADWGGGINENSYMVPGGPPKMNAHNTYDGCTFDANIPVPITVESTYYGSYSGEGVTPWPVDKPYRSRGLVVRDCSWLHPTAKTQVIDVLEMTWTGNTDPAPDITYDGLMASSNLTQDLTVRWPYTYRDVYDSVYPTWASEPDWLWLYGFTLGAESGTTWGAPLDPSDFTATENGADVDLAWTDNATNETGYYLEEAHDWTGDNPASEDWSPVATIAADATTYTDTPTYTTRIRYRIAAGNASGLSAWVESNTLGAALVAVVADASADAAAPTITQGVTSALAGATAAASAPSITAALTAAVAAAVGEAGTGTPLHSIAAALATATGEAITASITQAVAAVVAHAVGIAGAAAAPFGWARRDTDASEWTQRGTESGVWAKRDTDSSTWTRR